MISSIYKLAATLFSVLLICFTTISAQNHIDPEYIQVVSTENPIVIDGKLDESDWARRYDFLVFKPGFLGGDVEYGVTNGVLVDGTYNDTTTTFVKFMHNGLDLYISLQSNDQYVNKWGGSWEGDGLFMKIANASGAMLEYKLYFNASGVDPDIVFEQGLLGSAEAAAWKHPSTVVNDTTQIDSGYTAEMVIHLDQLGYTDPYSEIPVLINIFDPDGQTGSAGEEYNVGSYYKMWWGSEWGPDTRILRLADPPTRNAYMTEETIVLDGELNEDFWNNADHVIVGKGSSSSTGGYYMQWNDTLNSYTDQSMATVKFMHNGTDLYIGLESDDKSVGKWSPGWEADGLFLWITNKGEDAPTARMEIKNMFFDATIGAGAVFELSGSVPTGAAEGASYVPPGTVTHTETGGEDAGYSMEVVIHTDYFGYSVGDTVNLSVVVWDIDYADAASFDQNVSDYAPNWWGTQWADVNFEKHYLYRGVILSELTDVKEDNEKLITNYVLNQNYPNPFNPTTTIKYSIPERTNVSLKIYDVLGNEVETLLSKEQTAGTYSVEWKADQFASGVYFYTLQAGGHIYSKKMMLLK